jgi:hypothetical protein
MSTAQINLLQRLIKLDRRYWLKRIANQPVEANSRGVLIDRYQGVHPRTAESLVEAGLAVQDAQHTDTYLYLGTVNPEDQLP